MAKPPNKIQNTKLADAGSGGWMSRSRIPITELT